MGGGGGAEKRMGWVVAAHKKREARGRRSPGATAAPVMVALVEIHCLSPRVARARLLVLAVGSLPLWSSDARTMAIFPVWERRRGQRGAGLSRAPRATTVT
jgi:hypothetical protein